MPKQHKLMSEKQVANETRSLWNILLSYRNDNSFTKKSEVEIKALELEILYKIIIRDLVYQDKHERPLRKQVYSKLKTDTDTIHDPRASYVRKYILNPNTVNEPHFRILFQNLKELIDSHAIPELEGKVTYLAQRWESHHPGEKFFEK